ncbi:MAG: hypothetical protein ACLQE9_15185 [Roseiarcus sp.]
MVNAEVASGGELSCDGQIVGRLQGFRFTPEASVGAQPASLDGADIAGVIARELDVRANRLSEAVDASLVLANDGAIRWLGDPIAKIVGGDKLLAPRALILADENLTETAQQKAQARVDLWLAAYVRRLLGPLFELEAGVGLEGAARNVALQLSQALGVLERGRVAQDVKSLDQNARGMLRKLGVRFGAYYIYLPNLVKPAIRALATQLWVLRPGAPAVAAGLDELPQLAASGRTSFLADGAIPREIYRVAGFRLCEDRAVRVDIVERLADLIRPAVAYRPGVSAGEPPPGSADGDGFVVTGAMTSLTGCSGEPFAAVLRSLGFVSRRVNGPALTPAQPAGATASPVEASPESTDAAPAVEPPESVADGGAAAIAEASEDGQSPAGGEAPPSSDSVVAVAPAAEAAAALDEDVLIEVWRPRPPGRQRIPRRGPKERAAPPVSPAPAGEPQAARRVEAGNSARRRRPVPEAPQAGVEAASRPQEEGRGFRGARAPRRRADHAGAADAPSSHRSGPNRGGPPEERRPDGHAAPPARREPPINLDSPFAKLLALKSQLEAKGKGG